MVWKHVAKVLSRQEHHNQAIIEAIYSYIDSIHANMQCWSTVSKSPVLQAWVQETQLPQYANVLRDELDRDTSLLHEMVNSMASTSVTPLHYEVSSSTFPRHPSVTDSVSSFKRHLRTTHVEPVYALVQKVRWLLTIDFCIISRFFFQPKFDSASDLG